MKFMTVEETAKKWGVSNRQVQKLCSEGKIQNVEKFGTSWAIPANARKPLDGRTKKNKSNGLFRFRVD